MLELWAQLWLSVHPHYQSFRHEELQNASLECLVGDPDPDTTASVYVFHRHLAGAPPRMMWCAASHEMFEKFLRRYADCLSEMSTKMKITCPWRKRLFALGMPIPEARRYDDYDNYSGESDGRCSPDVETNYSA
jgi:hypothetical protein